MNITLHHLLERINDNPVVYIPEKFSKQRMLTNFVEIGERRVRLAIVFHPEIGFSIAAVRTFEFNGKGYVTWDEPKPDEINILLDKNIQKKIFEIISGYVKPYKVFDKFMYGDDRINIIAKNANTKRVSDWYECNGDRFCCAIVYRVQPTFKSKVMVISERNGYLTVDDAKRHEIPVDVLPLGKAKLIADELSRKF